MFRNILFILILTLSINACDSHKTLVAFDPDGDLQADIRRTDFGVPHIKADNLESLAFGNGYAQAEDHICILADSVVRSNSQRSRYFGPDVHPGDNLNIGSDFAIKALGLRELAEQNIETLSENSRALLSGFSKGYNQFLVEAQTEPSRISQACRNQAWLQAITPIDLLTNMYFVGILGSSANFLQPILYAHPESANEWMPTPALASTTIGARSRARVTPSLAPMSKPKDLPDMRNLSLGSNAWGIGKQRSQNKQGILLGNPHFPHTGNLRFWQHQAIIPGVLNVAGASIVGMPGIVNIGFNQNIAWSHTFSSAEHLVIYRMALVPGNKMSYVIDDTVHQVQSKTVYVDVNLGTAIVPFQKTIYYTDLGPILEVDGLLPWDSEQLFVIKDINLVVNEILDQWLALNTANNLQTFKQAFKDFNGIIFNNTIYADKAGNSFYIDDSPVPDLSPQALATLVNHPEFKAIHDTYGITVLPGHLSVMIYDQAIPYERVPKSENQDYVQNSNDSYWLANLEHPIAQNSPLYGPANAMQSFRTRMGLTLIHESAGDDNKFNAMEVEDALFSNRTYLAELVLDQLVQQCMQQGETPISLNASINVNIATACQILAQWDRTQNKSSVGGLIFREFAYMFNRNFLTTEFDANNPLNTPSGLSTDPNVLTTLARAVANLQNSGWDLQSTMGDVQFVERSLVDGRPSGERIAWPGGHHAEGGFNVFSHSLHGDLSLFPQYNYSPVLDVLNNQPLRSGLTNAGYQVRFGSSWMMVVGFNKHGPVARGLLTYSESNNPDSEHYLDQTYHYSEQQSLRPILYWPWQIRRHTLSHQRIKWQATE
ncbi:MAG: penicillin acylase family protein [Gammaproteobacteria bacterium]|nr:penicillin acylase family protein [Gammaproteobacteria bacterium]